jgi:hypothetical protein
VAGKPGVVIALVLHPVPGRPGAHDAMHGGRRLCRSRQPFLDGARALLAAGVAPETVLEARHRGSAIVALRSTVGEAARWTIEESDRDGLRRRLWRPRPSEVREEAPPSRAGAPEDARSALAGTEAGRAA